MITKNPRGQAPSTERGEPCNGPGKAGAVSRQPYTRADWVVGSRVVLEASSGRSANTGTGVVRSAGPKWVTLTSGSKYRTETGFGEFGWTAYPSRTAYEAELRHRRIADLMFRTFGGFSRSRRFTTEQLEAAAAALGLDVEAQP